MPRSTPSPAEQECAAAVSQRFKPTSPRQLERWRGRGLLRPLPRRALGRGAGSTSEVTQELVDEAAMVARLVHELSSLHEVALTLFMSGRYVTEEAVRSAYRDLFDFFVAEIEKAKAFEGQDLYDALDGLARRLARRGAGSAAARSRQRLQAAGLGDQLADVNYAALVAVTTGEVSSPGSLERLAVASGLDAMTRESLSDSGPVATTLDLAGAEELIAQSDVYTLRRRCDEVSWDELCAGRDAVAAIAGLARAMLVPASHQGAPEALGLRELALQSHVELAVAALAWVPLLTTMSEQFAVWLELSRVQTPLYVVAGSWLEALPPDLRARLPPIDATFAENLDPETRSEVKDAMLAWEHAHPDFAHILHSAGG